MMPLLVFWTSAVVLVSNCIPAGVCYDMLGVPDRDPRGVTSLEYSLQS